MYKYIWASLQITVNICYVIFYMCFYSRADWLTLLSYNAATDFLAQTSNAL